MVINKYINMLGGIEPRLDKNDDLNIAMEKKSHLARLMSTYRLLEACRHEHGLCLT